MRETLMEVRRSDSDQAEDHSVPPATTFNCSIRNVKRTVVPVAKAPVVSFLHPRRLPDIDSSA